MNITEKQIKVITTLFDVEFCNDDIEAFPNGYYISNDENMKDISYDPKDWEFDSNWNNIMIIIKRVADQNHISMIQMLRILENRYTIPDYSHIETVEDLFETVYNYCLKF